MSNDTAWEINRKKFSVLMPPPQGSKQILYWNSSISSNPQKLPSKIYFNVNLPLISSSLLGVRLWRRFPNKNMVCMSCFPYPCLKSHPLQTPWVNHEALHYVIFSLLLEWRTKKNKALISIQPEQSCDGTCHWISFWRFQTMLYNTRNYWPLDLVPCPDPVSKMLCSLVFL